MKDITKMSLSQAYDYCVKLERGYSWNHFCSIATANEVNATKKAIKRYRNQLKEESNDSQSSRPVR